MVRTALPPWRRHGAPAASPGHGMVVREPDALRRWHDMGMRFLVCNNDGNMIHQGATRDVAALAEFMDRA